VGKKYQGILTDPRASKHDFMHMGRVTEPEQEESLG